MDQVQHEDLQKRLDRLESGYYKWRRTGLVAIVAAVALFAYGAYAYGQPPKEVPQPPKNEAVQVPIDSTGMRTNYANFFRVTGNPDEVILDVGLYSQLNLPTGPEAVKLTDRTVMNYYTAKKLQSALQTVLTRHEDTYGEIQLDPEKRKKPKPVRD
jgi:hypothetical protein